MALLDHISFAALRDDRALSILGSYIVKGVTGNAADSAWQQAWHPFVRGGSGVHTLYRVGQKKRSELSVISL